MIWLKNMQKTKKTSRIEIHREGILVMYYMGMRNLSVVGG